MPITKFISEEREIVIDSSEQLVSIHHQMLLGEAVSMKTTSNLDDSSHM